MNFYELVLETLNNDQLDLKKLEQDLISIVRLVFDLDQSQVGVTFYGEHGYHHKSSSHTWTTVLHIEYTPKGKYIQQEFDLWFHIKQKGEFRNFKGFQTDLPILAKVSATPPFVSIRDTGMPWKEAVEASVQGEVSSYNSYYNLFVELKKRIDGDDKEDRRREVLVRPPVNTNPKTPELVPV